MFFEKLHSPMRWLTISMLAVIVSGSVGWYAFAQDNNNALPPSPDSTESAEDPFKIPQDASAQELAEYIQQLQEIPQQQASSQAEYIALMKEVAETTLKASELGLKIKDVKPEEQLPFIVMKVRSMVMMSQLGDENGIEQAMAFIKPYRDSENAQISSVAKDITQQLKLALFPSMNAEERQALVDEIFAEPEANGLTRFNFRSVLRLGETMEASAEPKEAAATYRRIAKLAAKSENEQIVELAEKFVGKARLVELPGNKMEVFGKTLDGNEIDWESYRGKVVLVDFWATWCGPCLQELPNVLANYEKYHDRGFEVVGVNLDNEKSEIQGFIKKHDIPWTNIFPEDPESRGWNHPMATYYGIEGIPSVILVDQEGKVVSTMARGPELERLLAELFDEEEK